MGAKAKQQLSQVPISKLHRYIKANPDFVQLLSLLGEEAEYSEDRWHELIDMVRVDSDRKLVFTLTDGTKHTIALQVFAH